MKKLYFFLAVLGLLIGVSMITYAFNPKHLIIITPPASTTTINVYFSTGNFNCPASRYCSFTYHLYEYNSKTQQYNQLDTQPFYYNTYSYTFPNESFDESSYDEIVVSIEVNGSCNGYEYSNKYKHVPFQSGTTNYTISDPINPC